MGPRSVIGEFTMAGVVTAPLAVEAVGRTLTGRTRTTGVASAGALFDAPDFLRALSPHIPWNRTRGGGHRGAPEPLR
ncbi:hypothetical protein SUDANB176_05884 [Streptomyces sp. enrichment culture]